MEQLIKERRKSALEYVSDKTLEIAGKRWPKYVVEDMLYTIFKDDPEPFGEWVRQFIEDYPNREWKLIELEVIEDIFDDKTRSQLETREGGKSNPHKVPRDEKRHEIQTKLLKEKGISTEPIIVVEHNDGKYELIEGWHRTIQSLIEFPDGYKQNAWVYTLQKVDNTNDEEFELDFCDKCMQMKNFKDGECQKCKAEQIEEDVDPEDIDVSSFEAQKKLSEDFFDEDDEIKPEIRKKLLQISDDFYESLEIPKVDIDDIIVTGSIVNYNWSKYSDVDLHIIIDISEVDDNMDFAKDYLNAKRWVWNERHNITLGGYEVEIYMQDVNEPHHSTGVYSIIRNKWEVKPKKLDGDYDRSNVKKKASDLINRIESLEAEINKGEYDELIGKIEQLRKKIKRMRAAGLSDKGEYSVENITFKVLRRTGYMGRLLDLQTKAYDLSLSI